ncbi:shikimate dehydrogenase [Alkalibacillus aidingensis]|uniref:shikimate dehydrogenase n=1 Tax=Alkalibacillus aidingensis TaxID=2747607 RepID=UPI00166117AA|nr:shikimate dehydrogenase [Alkalibacillus aidingensis]
MYRLALIGNPVKQSKSPEIHQQFFEQTSLKGTYELIPVDQVELEGKINWLKAEGYHGFNVTVPFKEKIIEYLDEIVGPAKAMQSVNTVSIQNNRLVGYNTDGEGYVLSLNEAYPDFLSDVKHKRILIIGAGGAAKGIAYQLNKYAFQSIDIINRTAEKARQISRSLNHSRALSLGMAKDILEQYDLIIQTTSVGMSPNNHEQIISLQGVKPNAIASDIIYKPKWTSFLQDAEQRGCRILFGESMLLYQAAKAFQIWTGQEIKDFVN